LPRHAAKTEVNVMFNLDENINLLDLGFVLSCVSIANKPPMSIFN